MIKHVLAHVWAQRKYVVTTSIHVQDKRLVDVLKRKILLSITYVGSTRINIDIPS
jgi:hypothetical protein